MEEKWNVVNGRAIVTFGDNNLFLENGKLMAASIKGNTLFSGEVIDGRVPNPRIEPLSDPDAS